MVSLLGTVFLLQAVTFVYSFLPIENMEYGLSQAEKVVKGLCWLEQFRNPFLKNRPIQLYEYCKNRSSYVDALRHYQTQANEYEWIDWIYDYIIGTLPKILPQYVPCAYKYISKPGDTTSPPAYQRNYGKLLKDKISGWYPLKSFTHCLVGLVAANRGNESLLQLKAYWDGPKKEASEMEKAPETPTIPKEDAKIAPAPLNEELAKEIEGEEEAVEEEKAEEQPVEVANEEVAPKFSIEDVEYGLTQAKKVAAGICWIEKLNKPYPKNDGGIGFLDCKKNHDYLQILQKCREVHQGKDAETFEDCWKIAIQEAVVKHLPEYSPCLPFLQGKDKPPKKDYGEFLGDSEKSEYLYKGYTHCLLKELEDDNGQQGLDDLKSKWENPKTLVEVMLQRENEHRSWHSSPPLEIDEELTRRAQSYADHLAAEVCAPTHMLSNDPEKRYNGSKCGENVSAHSDLTLSDDEMAAMAAVGWYKENELYPWPLFNGSMDVWTANMVGHFTQTVWKESIRVGYAIARETEACQKIFVVARYWPAGNKFYKQEERTRESFEKNVLPSIQ